MCIIIFSFAQILLSTLTLASVSKVVHREELAMAFGVVEILDSALSFLVNAAFALLYFLFNNYVPGMVLLLLVSYVGCMLVFFTSFIANRRLAHIAQYLPLQ